MSNTVPQYLNLSSPSSNPNATNLDPRERYELGGIIGEGGYGKVCQAYDTIRNQLVAIKIIDLEAAGDEVQDAHKEIAVMANLHCPHLIQYYASYVIGSKLWIVMEYLDAGSLLDIIKEFGPLPESHIAYIIKEVLLALQYLHHERKIHRDIKAGNLLAGSNGSVKLADFGVAGQLTDSVDKRQSKIGTPFWMAPEVITESKYDGKADIWSLGITAIELATGLPPYAQKVHPFKVIILIPKNPPPVLEGDFSNEFKDFVANCLVKDPTHRPTATQLLSHPFVANATCTEEWKSFITEKVMVNRYVPEQDASGELVRTGSNDSNCSNWNYTQRTAGSSSSRQKALTLPGTNSGGMSARTPRQGSSRGFIGLDNANTTDDVVLNSPRTPMRSNSERNLDDVLGLNPTTPRGLMSPGQRQRSSPRLIIPLDENLSQGGSTAGRSRKGSGNSETLLILSNSSNTSNNLSGGNSSGSKTENELTPPVRVNPVRAQGSGFDLPPLAFPSTIPQSSAIPETIHIESNPHGYREVHSSISNSSSREYDAGSSLHDSHSLISSQNPLQPQPQKSHITSDLHKAKSLPNVNSSLSFGTNSIAFPSMDSGSQGPSLMISTDELQSYLQTWKQKEDHYLNEIYRLKEENVRLRSISKPFLSTVSLLVKQTSSKNVSSASFDQYLGSGGNNSHNNSTNQLPGLFLGAAAEGVGGDHNFHQNQMSSSSFRDLHSILSISSDDTTPGNSRSLSPAAVVRDDIFADLATTHPNHPLLQFQMQSAASSTNSLLPGGFSTQPLTSDQTPPPDPFVPSSLNPSEEKKGNDDSNILIRKSSFLLPPLPPNHHPSNTVPLTVSVSESYSLDDGSHYSNPNLLKSEETVPYPAHVIERGGGGGRSSSLPADSNDSAQPLGTSSFPEQSHSLDSADFELRQNMKHMLKTPKGTGTEAISTSIMNAQHRRFLETVLHHHLQHSSTSTTTGNTENGSGPADASIISHTPATISHKFMNAVIKPTLQEVKQRIESNQYTPELLNVIAQPDSSALPTPDKVAAAVNNAAAAANLKEAEQRRQQLENVWLLLATGFTALEKIMSSSPSTPLAGSAVPPPSSSQFHSPKNSPFKSTNESSIQNTNNLNSTGSSSTTSSPPSNILLDIATLMTSFTLGEVDEQP